LMTYIELCFLPGCNGTILPAVPIGTSRFAQIFFFTGASRNLQNSPTSWCLHPHSKVLSGKLSGHVFTGSSFHFLFSIDGDLFFFSFPSLRGKSFVIHAEILRLNAREVPFRLPSRPVVFPSGFLRENYCLFTRRF